LGAESVPLTFSRTLGAPFAAEKDERGKNKRKGKEKARERKWEELDTQNTCDGLTPTSSST